MVTYQKRMSLLLCLLMSGAAFADEAQTQPLVSGEQKVLNIMTDSQEGVAAYNKEHLKLAESVNLATDLNIAAITERLGCKTHMGRAFLQESLSSPLNTENKDVLLKRQQIIRALVENPELKQEVEEMIEHARKHEEHVMTLLSDDFKNQKSPQVAELENIKTQNPWLYRFAKSINKSTTVATIGHGLGVLTIAGMVYATKYFGEIAKQGIETVYKAKKAGATVLWTDSGLMSVNAYAALVAVLCVETAYCGGFTGYTTYKFAENYMNNVAKRQKMHSLYTLIKIAEKSEALCAKYNLDSQFKMSAIENKTAIALIDSLKSSRYEDVDAMLVFSPAVQTLAIKLYEEDKNLAQLFACIAELDVYNALANKIIESKEKDHTFCFATFIDDAKPAIKTEGFWNILVDNPVVNGISQDQHVILTGPNAGGKTTSIRSLLQNIVLAQTFGVAAAETFELTMFDVIHSFLNVSDDLINGDSLFKAEVKRAQGILQKIQSLEPGKKYFFALDELFTGTGAVEGEQCAYAFINRIADFENILFIYATHFNKLKELADTNSNCANYKVDAPTRDENGKLVYPFTLSPGANQINVAIDIAQEAGLFA